MVDTTAPKTRKNTNTETEDLLGMTTPFKNPIVKNVSIAIMWVDDETYILPSETAIRGRGGIIKEPQGKMTQEQWSRRTPEQWGVLEANGLADVRVFPNSVDEERCSKAKEAEENRLSNAELAQTRAREAREAQEKR